MQVWPPQPSTFGRDSERTTSASQPGQTAERSEADAQRTCTTSGAARAAERLGLALHQLCAHVPSDAGGRFLRDVRVASEALASRRISLVVPPDCQPALGRLMRLMGAMPVLDAHEPPGEIAVVLFPEHEEHVALFQRAGIEVIQPSGCGFTCDCPLSRRLDEHAQRRLAGPVRPVRPVGEPVLEGGAVDPALRVLLVEDDCVNQLVVGRYLENLGVHATVVSDGIDALAGLETNDYDVILMDCSLPVMDGFATTEAIRARLGKAQPYIVAISATSNPEHRRRCFEVGMDALLPKPLDLRTLRAVLLRAREGR